MTLSAVFFAAQAGIVRYLAKDLHFIEISFFRAAFGIVVMMPWLIRVGVSALKTPHTKLYIWRGFLGTVAMYGWFGGLTLIPLADATAISFTFPLFIALSGVLFLKETAHLTRWIALAVGFAGTLIVIRPGFQEVNIGVFMVIGAGIFTITASTAGNITGPAISISFIIAAIACGLAALCYAEFASTVPVAGSAYTFSYATFGEFMAWIIGWDLILEFAVAEHDSDGSLAAEFAFGPRLGTFMGLLLALLLISTISAMILAGPRVLHRIGQDYPRFAPLARENRDGIPVTAILLQSGTALAFLWTASFEQILVFSGATMALNTFATVLGLFILRWRQPQLSRPFRVTFYPITPLIFLGITGWTLTYVVLQRPVEALISAAIVASGGVFYWLVRPDQRPNL